MFVFILFAASIYYVSNTNAQYYYIGQPALFQFSNPASLNSFGNQFSTYHGNPNVFRNIPAAPFYSEPITPPTPIFRRIYNTAENSVFHRNENQNFARNQNQNFARNQNQNFARNFNKDFEKITQQTFSHDHSDYRGFAYQTKTDNGATSRVFFATGPQSRGFSSFTSYTAPNVLQNDDTNKARNFASDMIDPVKKNREENVLPKQTQNIYKTPNLDSFANDPDNFFKKFFDNSASQMVNFYSINSQLFAEPAPGYPADTFPLNQPDYPALSSRFSANNQNDIDIEITTENNGNANKKIDNEETAESVITNTRFKLNEFTDNSEKLIFTTSASMISESVDNSQEITTDRNTNLENEKTEELISTTSTPTTSKIVNDIDNMITTENESKIKSKIISTTLSPITETTEMETIEVTSETNYLTTTSQNVAIILNRLADITEKSTEINKGQETTISNREQETTISINSTETKNIMTEITNPFLIKMSEESSTENSHFEASTIIDEKLETTTIKKELMETLEYTTLSNIMKEHLVDSTEIGIKLTESEETSENLYEETTTENKLTENTTTML